MDVEAGRLVFIAEIVDVRRTSLFGKFARKLTSTGRVNAPIDVRVEAVGPLEEHGELCALGRDEEGPAKRSAEVFSAMPPEGRFEGDAEYLVRSAAVNGGLGIADNLGQGAVCRCQRGGGRGGCQSNGGRRKRDG